MITFILFYLINVINVYVAMFLMSKIITLVGLVGFEGLLHDMILTIGFILILFLLLLVINESLTTIFISMTFLCFHLLLIDLSNFSI